MKGGHSVMYQFASSSVLGRLSQSIMSSDGGTLGL